MINSMENTTSWVAMILLCYKGCTMVLNVFFFSFCVLVHLRLWTRGSTQRHQAVTMGWCCTHTEREGHSVGYKHLLKEEEWDGERRRELLKGMLPVGTYTQSQRRSVHCAGVSGGESALAISRSTSHEASLTAFAYRGHLASRHKGARMFIVGIMNVIIHCYPRVGNFKSIKSFSRGFSGFRILVHGFNVFPRFIPHVYTVI